MQFKFPLHNKNGKEIIEKAELLKALRTEGSGFFPINADGLWHNGIHFTDNGNSQLNLDEAIGCIADGEVVAYRLPSSYKRTSIAGVDYPYSNAFTLIRHTYETPKGNILVFFSLYMNLLPSELYSSRNSTQDFPGYLLGERAYKVGGQATDIEEFAGSTPGLRVRHEASGDVIALLPQGTELSLKNSNSDWKQIKSLFKGKAIIKPAWVWSPVLEEQGDSGVYTVGNSADDTEDFAPNISGLRMRAEARGRVIALLPKGTEVTLDQQHDGNWHKIKSIISGDPVLAPGWVFAPELDETIKLTNNNRYQVKSTASDIENEISEDTKGLRIRLEPGTEVIGLLKTGDQVILGEQQGNWAKIITVLHPSSPLLSTPLYKKGWVWLAELDKPASKKSYYRVGNAANDRPDFAKGVAGLNMRLEPNGFLLGLLPKDSSLELGTRQNQWAQVEDIQQGEPIYNTAWVWVPELDHIADNLYKVGNKATDTETGFAPGEVGIRMRDLATRAIVALLPRGVQIELEPHNNRWAKIRSIANGEAIYPPAWVWVAELDPPRPATKVFQASPQAQDQADFASGQTGLNMRMEPNGIIMGLLPRGVHIELESSTNGWSRISQTTRGEAIYDHGWVWVPELDRLSENRYHVGNLAIDKEPDFTPNAPDTKGLRMRHFFSREIIALLPQGTELELEANTGRWAKVKSIHKVTPFYRSAWVWTAELEEVKSTDSAYTVGDAANDLHPSFAGSASGLRMRTEPGGDIMALIPKGVKLEIDEVRGSWAKIKSFTQGEPIYTQGWIWTPDLKEISQVTDPDTEQDSITLISKTIKAGESIGYAGQYHDITEQNQHHFHLQVFTADNLPKFMTNPYQDTGGKELLLIPSQTPLFDQTETDIGMGFEASGISLANDIVIDAVTSTVEGSTTTEGSTTVKDSQGIEWIEVNGYSFDSPSEQGWVKKIAAQPISSLEWPGFHIFDTTNETIADIADRNVLENIFSSYPSTSANPPLPSSIITQAHRNEAQLDSLCHSIIRNESILTSTTQREEWLDRRTKYLTQQIGNTADVVDILADQQQRLNEWNWWDEAAENIRDFPRNKQAYYFHPISFIENIASHPDKYILADFPSLITLEMLQTVHRGNTLYYREILPYMNEFANKYNVNTPLRIAHFLSQIGHESSFIIRNESLKYSVNRMRSIFGNNGARTKLYSNPGFYAYFYRGGRITGNDVHLGNYVYANRIGNGNESSGDGFRYHGRGMIQLTGKSNYQQYNTQHNKTSPEDPQDFLTNPDLIVSNKRYGVESAFVWWQLNNMNRQTERTHPNFSPRSSVNSRIKSITKLVNGGFNGLTDRTNNFWKVWKILA